MNTLITKLYNHLKLIHLEDAATVLCGLLTAGTIPATAFDPVNDDHEVRLDKSYWKSLTAEQSEQVFQDGSAAVKEVMHSGKEINFRMHIFVPDWALDLLPIGSAAASTGASSKGGREPVIDWTVVWIGVVYLMSQPKRPTNQEELIRDISFWCDENFGDGVAPGETVLKEKFSGLFRIIDGEPAKSVFPNGSRLKRKRQKTPANKKKVAGR
jgi:hypothetical protein